jgi:CRISPR-associated protein Cmr3
MFEYLIKITPLGLMYGSAGGFLSPENLVGRSGHKFPPDAAAAAGLLLNVNREQGFLIPHADLSKALYVAGPFWAESKNAHNFYVPIPRHKIFAKDNKYDEWRIENHEWSRSQNEEKRSLKSEYHWQLINQWDNPTDTIASNKKAVAKEPWKYVSFLHPKTKEDERVSLEEDGLFLENAVQLDDGYCLIYLSTHPMPVDGWYRFGGEGHMVEVESEKIRETSEIYRLQRKKKIERAFALITPGVWGSNNLSYRYPQHPDFPQCGIKMLTDKPVPYRFRLGASKNQEQANKIKQPPGRLGRGRYAVPVGTVYVLKKPLVEEHSTWWQFPDEWFAREGKGIAGQETEEKGLRLKHFGCGLCLPVTIQGV